MSLLQMQRETKSEKGQKPNLTGIPSYMKQDFEARSGLSYDDVRIHYSSPKPAELGALAYTQGSHVYIGPGQERHLPHELIHVAQQKRGEVRPTGSLGGVPVNDDPDLERQADAGTVVQRAQAPSGPASQIVQRKIGMEYQTVGREINVYQYKNSTLTKNTWLHGNTLFTVPYTRSKKIKVTMDGPDLEYVTPAVDTPGEALAAGRAAAHIHRQLMTYNDANLHIAGLRSINAESIKNTATRAAYKRVNNDTRKRSWMCTTGNGIFVLMNIKDSAHPQATVGIRMDKIADLLLELGGTASGLLKKNRSGTVPLGLTSSLLKDTRAETRREGMGLLARQKKTMWDAPNKAKRALREYLLQNEGAKAKNPARIVGLLSLLFAYNAQYHIIAQHPRAAANAKNAMPVMSRTSLYDAYRTLNANDREIFRGVMQREITIRSPKRWSTTTFTYQDPSSKNPIDVDEIVLAGQFMGMDGDSEVWNSLNLDDWVAGLSARQDVMFRHNFDSVGRLANTEVLPQTMKDSFGIEKSTDIGLGDAAPGLLVELRGLERGVPSVRWGTIAKQVAELVNRLNKVPQPNKGKPNSSSKVKSRRR